MRNGRFADVKDYITPDLRDVIFYEEIDDLSFNAECWQYCITAHKCKTDHKFVYAGPVNTRTGKRRVYYAALREDQWKYNHYYSGLSSLGGSKFETYERVYIVPRDSWTVGQDYNGDAIAFGDDDPEDVNHTPYGAGFVLDSVRQLRTREKELDACYVMLIFKFVKPCVIQSSMYDPACDAILPVTIETVPKGSVAPVPMDANGVTIEVRDINCNWSQVITKTSVCDGSSKTYATYINYRWPAVLQQIENMTWYTLDRRPIIKHRVEWLRQAQTIPTKATITRTLHATPQTLPTPIAMLPNSINYAAPEFSLNVPACLHGDITVVSDYGTNNPVFDFATGSTRLYPETEFTDGNPALDWPASLLISATQKPYSKGGYVVETVTIESPV